MRLMSFRMTIDQIKDRSKTVTRRFGWKDLHVGTRLCAVDRSPRGMRDGEDVERLAVIEVVSVERGYLDDLEMQFPGDAVLEGFPELTDAEFTRHFCQLMKIHPHTQVTRVEFRYVDGVDIPEEQD